MEGFLREALRIDWPGIAVPTVSIVEKAIRPILVYAFLIIALRIAGKREMAQINTFDFVVLMLLSNTVQNAIIGNDNSVVGGIVGAISLLAVNFLVVRFLFRHPAIEDAFEGRPDVLILDGKVNEARLAKELITRAELETAARKQGIEALAEVERAEIDPDGQLIFERKAPPAEILRHAELLRRLDGLAREVEDLRRELREGR